MQGVAVKYNNLSLKEAVCDGNICNVFMNIMNMLWIGPHNIEIVEVYIFQCNAFFLC